MKKIIAILIITFITAAAFAQSTHTFPQSFVGKWKGSLQWLVAGKPTQTFTMQLHIKPTDTAGVYTWQIIYGDDAKDNRPYLLKPIDTAKGHWVVDEKDGIVLDGYVLGNTYTGAFTVQNNTIVDTYRVENDTMFVSFLSINLNAKNTSGKGTDEVPTVTSYKIGSYQQGILQKLP
ncbi:hypothetical protein ACFOWM_07835 [Ferruginibacter yonginensis]|uniref:Lipocalin-like domain-containing protein n=1 Tax=Ferruginibacter yonginensis TaxID=1310416 RepID=A0ABV8QSF1_9BACT